MAQRRRPRTAGAWIVLGGEGLAWDAGVRGVEVLSLPALLPVP